MLETQAEFAIKGLIQRLENSKRTIVNNNVEINRLNDEMEKSLYEMKRAEGSYDISLERNDVPEFFNNLLRIHELKRQIYDLSFKSEKLVAETNSLLDNHLATTNELRLLTMSLLDTGKPEYRHLLEISGEFSNAGPEQHDSQADKEESARLSYQHVENRLKSNCA